MVHATRVAVVHEHPLVRVNFLEYSRTLHGGIGLLQVVVFGCPFPAQGLGGSFLYAIALPLGLEEHVVPAVVPHDVGIDGVQASVVVEHLGLGEVGEVLIGIRVVGDVVLATLADGVVHHVFALFGVVDGLRCPHLGECVAVEAVGPSCGEVDGGVCPVDHVGRAQQHHAVIGAPPLA